MKIWNQNETLCCSFFVICKNPWPGEKWSSWDATFCLWVEQQDGMEWGGRGPILEIIQRGHISSVVKNKVPAWPTTETHPWVCYIVIPAWMLWNLKTHMNMECHNWRTPLWQWVFVISNTRDETTTKTSPIGGHNIHIPQYIHLTWDRFALLTQFCRSAAWCNSKRPRIIW